MKNIFTGFHCKKCKSGRSTLIVSRESQFRSLDPVRPNGISLLTVRKCKNCGAYIKTEKNLSRRIKVTRVTVVDETDEIVAMAIAEK